MAFPARLRLLAAIVMMLAVLSWWLPAHAAQTTTLSIVSWGGAYAESQRKAYFEPFMRANPGIRIEVIDAGGEQVRGLREQARDGVITWDLVDVSAADAIRLCREGIAVPVDHNALLAMAPGNIPPSEDFGQTIVSECFIPEIVYSTTFGYRTDKLVEAPTGICDVFDLKKFPGKRALERRPINNLEWALICDGVLPEQVYEVLDTEEGIARAFAKLDTIRREVIWWSAGHEPVDLLAKGEVVLASAYNGRLFDLITRKPAPARSKKKSKSGAKPEASVPVPVAMLWNRQAFDFDGWIIPHGRTKVDAIQKFLRFATDTQRLADQASYISYGPARRSSASLVGKHAELGIEMKPFLPTSPENAKATLIYNYDWWAANRDHVDRLFQAWLASGGPL